MNNERLALLLKYMDGLTTMMANDYRCVSEIDECVGWIRKEFTKEPQEPTEIVEFRGFNGFIDKGRNGIE